jgi:hypothetical protein
VKRASIAAALSVLGAAGVVASCNLFLTFDDSQIPADDTGVLPDVVVDSVVVDSGVDSSVIEGGDGGVDTLTVDDGDTAPRETTGDVVFEDRDSAIVDTAVAPDTAIEDTADGAVDPVDGADAD